MGPVSDVMSGLAQPFPEVGEYTRASRTSASDSAAQLHVSCLFFCTVLQLDMLLSHFTRLETLDELSYGQYRP
jgi:hypothetical protein